MNPDQQGPVPGQISANWGDPQKVQQFRNALIPQIGQKAADDYVSQYQAAFEEQQKNTVTGAIGANQGGITPNQATQNPVGALNFLGKGGQLVNTGPDAQAKILNDAGSYFQKHSNKQGYVSPQDYNNYLAQYNQAGGDAAAFHKTFTDKYVDPKNAFYDTPDAKAAQSTLPIIKQVIDSYHNLKFTGQAVKSLSDIPIVGPYIQQNYLHAQTAHDKFLTGEIGNIRQIAGAGSNQGFRFNLNELNNIAGLLPQSTDNQAIANDKLSQLDTFLKNNMGIGLKQLYGK